MATLSMIQTGLFSVVSDALAAVAYQTFVGIGWPAMRVLQDVARGPPAIVAIYNRRIGRNATRWLPYSYGLVLIPAAVTSAVSWPVVDPGGTAVVTLTGTPNVGDAVSLGVFVPGFMTQPTLVSWGSQLGQVAVAGPGASAASLVDQLANQVDEDPTIIPYLRAFPNGDGTVTLTSIATVSLRLTTSTGNGGTAQREIGRRAESFQIACWAQTTEYRDLVCDPIDTTLALAELAFGPTLVDGTAVRLLNDHSYDIEDATLNDVYRRDFILTMEWPVTVLDQLYAVLVPSVSQQMPFLAPAGPVTMPVTARGII